MGNMQDRMIVLTIAGSLVLASACAAGGGGEDAGSDTTVDPLLDADGLTDPGVDGLDEPPVDGTDAADPDGPSDPATETPVDGIPDTTDATDALDATDASDVTDAADTADSGLSDCVASGGTCIVATSCVTCPGSLVPSWGDRGCGTGNWCCVRAGADTPCTSGGGVCLPSSTTGCPPGWRSSSASCGSGLSCCRRDC